MGPVLFTGVPLPAALLEEVPRCASSWMPGYQDSISVFGAVVLPLPWPKEGTTSKSPAPVKLTPPATGRMIWLVEVPIVSLLPAVEPNVAPPLPMVMFCVIVPLPLTFLIAPMPPWPVPKRDSGTVEREGERAVVHQRAGGDEDAAGGTEGRDLASSRKPAVIVMVPE